MLLQSQLLFSPPIIIDFEKEKGNFHIGDTVMETVGTQSRGRWWPSPPSPARAGPDCSPVLWKAAAPHFTLHKNKGTGTGNSERWVTCLPMENSTTNPRYSQGVVLEHVVTFFLRQRSAYRMMSMT